MQATGRRDGAFWAGAVLLGAALAMPAQAIAQTSHPAEHQPAPVVNAKGCCAKHKAPDAAAHEHAATPAQDALETVKAWLEAIPAQNLSRIDELLADDFVATLPDGRSRTKAEHLAEVRTGAYRVQSLTFEDPKVRIFGDVAVVTYYQVEDSRLLGEEMTGMSVWTDVLVKRDGRWQIVAEHGSNVG